MSSQEDKSGDSIEDKSRESTRVKEEGTSTPREQVRKHSEVRFVLSSSDVSRPAKQEDDVAESSISKPKASILKQSTSPWMSSTFIKSNLSLDNLENNANISKATEILGSNFQESTEAIMSHDNIDGQEEKQVSFHWDTSPFFVDGKRYSRGKRNTIDSPAFLKQSYEDSNIEEQVVFNHNVTYNDEQARWWIIIICSLIWFTCMISFYIKISTLKDLPIKHH